MFQFKTSIFYPFRLITRDYPGGFAKQIRTGIMPVESICLKKNKIILREFKHRNGGGGRIRTLEALASLAVFETAPFNHSGTPPRKDIILH